MKLDIGPRARLTSARFAVVITLWRYVVSFYRRYGMPAYTYVRDYSHIHQALIGLTIFILVNNALVVQAANDVPDIPLDVFVSDPYEIADTVRLLESYTPGIEEDPEAIALSLEDRVDGTFISSNPLLETQPGQTDEPQPSPTHVAQPQDRTKDIKYTVQIGDTMSGIGSKFKLKVATIKVKNNISDVDSLKPGQELVIPPQDLSDKAIKAADDRKKASTELARSGGSTKRIIPTAKAGGYGLAVPIRHNGISRGLIGGHTGIDYRANVGTSVVSAKDGTVVIASESGWNGGYGRYVVITHGDGMITYYAHLSDVRVNPGQRVSQGEVVGLSGNTGRSTGPHLHFELRVNGVARNPF